MHFDKFKAATGYQNEAIYNEMHDEEVREIGDEWYSEDEAFRTLIYYWENAHEYPQSPLEVLENFRRPAAWAILARREFDK